MECSECGVEFYSLDNSKRKKCWECLKRKGALKFEELNK